MGDVPTLELDKKRIKGGLLTDEEAVKLAPSAVAPSKNSVQLPALPVIELMPALDVLENWIVLTLFLMVALPAFDEPKKYICALLIVKLVWSPALAELKNSISPLPLHMKFCL